MHSLKSNENDDDDKKRRVRYASKIRLGVGLKLSGVPIVRRVNRVFDSVL